MGMRASWLLFAACLACGALEFYLILVGIMERQKAAHTWTINVAALGAMGYATLWFLTRNRLD